MAICDATDSHRDRRTTRTPNAAPLQVGRRRFSSRRRKTLALSHLLKSNCPVTGRRTGPACDRTRPRIDRAGRAALYGIVREHDGFHEHESGSRILRCD